MMCPHCIYEAAIVTSVLAPIITIMVYWFKHLPSMVHYKIKSIFIKSENKFHPCDCKNEHDKIKS